MIRFTCINIEPDITFYLVQYFQSKFLFMHKEIAVKGIYNTLINKFLMLVMNKYSFFPKGKSVLYINFLNYNHFNITSNYFSWFYDSIALLTQWILLWRNIWEKFYYYRHIFWNQMYIYDIDWKTFDITILYLFHCLNPFASHFKNIMMTISDRQIKNKLAKIDRETAPSN